MIATSAAASEPREIKLHPTAREIGVSLESVAAAPAIVGGSLRNLTPLFCLPGKATAHNSQPDHGNCKDLTCPIARPSWCDDGEIARPCYFGARMTHKLGAATSATSATR